MEVFVVLPLKKKKDTIEENLDLIPPIIIRALL